MKRATLAMLFVLYATTSNAAEMACFEAMQQAGLLQYRAATARLEKLLSTEAPAHAAALGQLNSAFTDAERAAAVSYLSAPSRSDVESQLQPALGSARATLATAAQGFEKVECPSGYFLITHDSAKVCSSNADPATATDADFVNPTYYRAMNATLAETGNEDGKLYACTTLSGYTAEALSVCSTLELASGAIEQETLEHLKAVECNGASGLSIFVGSTAVNLCVGADEFSTEQALRTCEELGQ